MAVPLDPTPVIVAVISAFGAVSAAYYSYTKGRKTDNKIKSLPNDLVSEFSKLNPGVDTVEKVIELLYAEIGRLNEDNKTLREKVEKLVAEKQDLLDEIQKMKVALDEQKRKLGYLEARIKKSIPSK